MNWTVRIARRAAREIAALPRNRQAQIRQQLRDMESDPFQGDVRPLRGEWQGFHRKRVGRYRIIFRLVTDQHAIDIVAVRPRSDQTY